MPEVPDAMARMNNDLSASNGRGRVYRAVLLACGAALFAFLIVSIGPGTIAESFRVLSWRLLVLIVFPCAVLKMFDALAWRFAFPRDSVPLSRLLASLLGGQAVSSTTPAGMLGGNAVMAWMLRDRVSLRESLASLIIVQTTSTVSQGLFLLLGIVLARSTISPSQTLVRAMEWLLILECIGVIGFVVVQMRGVMAGVHRVLTRFGFSGSTWGEAATDVDEALATFYRHRPRRLALSLICSFLGWITKAAEVWLILYLLGARVPVTTALIIEAFATGISFATFFLPTDIGVEEGGAVATFLALGMNGATGLSLSLVRRVREVAWIGIGLLLIAGQRRLSAATVPARSA
jgi:glycosyltransferase 2 family protein